MKCSVPFVGVLSTDVPVLAAAVLTKAPFGTLWKITSTEVFKKVSNQRVTILLPLVKLSLRVVNTLALILMGFTRLCRLTPTESVNVDSVDREAEFVC